MTVIGLTGQTGAGKTTAAETFAALGCGIVNADLVAREAMAPGSDCLVRVAQEFGQDIILPDGGCDRRLLAARAFRDRESTRRLSALTHPWIIRRAGEYISELANKHYGIIIFDAPQLFESGGDRLCDVIVAVTAPEEIRLDRIMRRDGISRAQAMQRIRAQQPEEFYRSRADYVIDGAVPREQLRQQTEAVYLRISHTEVKE